MDKSFKITDISLPIYGGMPVYPNNPPVKITSLKTPNSYISEITLGSHTGTHIDVPRHINENGLTVDKIELDQLSGPVRVLDMTHCKESISVEDLKKENIKAGERILVKTQNSIRGFKEFYPDYIYLSGEAAEFLAEQKIIIFGIDSISIKQKGSPDLRPHTELLNNNIIIIEGLDLSKANPGSYNLFCLPLNLIGLDGAPARAILTNLS